MSQSKNYQKTMYACFIGYIVQAVVNNFVPLLFVVFQDSYHIPLSQITALITINFLIQLGVDLLSAGVVDKLGYRTCVLLAHGCAAAGLVLLAFLPDLLPNPFAGILIAVGIYAVGGGLIEVLISPILEACPTKNKEKAMSLLHSFYCWGHVGVVLISTVFFRLAGVGNWRILTVLWALIPVGNLVLPSRGGRNGADAAGAVYEEDLLDPDAHDAVRRRQRAGGEPVGIDLRRKGSGCEQDRGRSGRTDGVCRTHGHLPPDLRQIRRPAEPEPLHDAELFPVYRRLWLYLPDSQRCCGTGGVRSVRILRGNPLAGHVQ